MGVAMANSAPIPVRKLHIVLAEQQERRALTKAPGTLTMCHKKVTVVPKTATIALKMEPADPVAVLLRLEATA